MKKTKEALWKDYNDVDEKIKVVDIDNERYELLLETKDKLRNELIKIDQVNMEFLMKQKQIEAENKREKTRNAITIVSFVITTGVGIWTVIKTFRFDQTSTITSTLGRSGLTNVVSKIFKR